MFRVCEINDVIIKTA